MPSKKVSVEFLKPLINIVEKWRGESSYDLGQALDDLSTTGLLDPNIYMKITEDSETIGSVKEILESVFMLAARAIEVGEPHGLYSDLADIALIILPFEGQSFATIEFLTRLADRYNAKPSESEQTKKAVNALIAGLASKSLGVSESCLFKLSLFMGRLTREERLTFVNAIESDAFPDQLKDSLLTRGTLRHHKILEDLGTATERRKKATLSKDTHVISVHSHKGGVGKTVVSLALALYLENHGARVCLVDADDEGPSQHFYLPVDKEFQTKQWFFSNWYCGGRKKLPEGLVQPVPGHNIKFISGSLHATDLDILDSFQRGHRPENDDYTILKKRIELLVQGLIDKYGFTHVIIDTAPGLAHLSYEIMMATIGLGGRLVFVMRPRPVDVFPFCSDWESIPRRLKLPVALVINQVDDERRNLFNNSNSLAKSLVQLPQFLAYTPKFGSWDPESLADWFSRIFNEFNGKRFYVDHVDILAHAADVQTLYDPSNSMLNGVSKCNELLVAAEKISNILQLLKSSYDKSDSKSKKKKAIGTRKTRQRQK